MSGTKGLAFIVLAGLALRSALRRLVRDRTFSVFVVVSVALTGALCSLAAAWLLETATLQLPYGNANQLWFVQIGHPGETSGSELQASSQLARDFVGRQSVFDQIVLAKPAGTRLDIAASRDGETISVLRVEQDFWKVLQVAPAVGYEPRSNSGEIAISNAWAVAHYGRASLAIGKIVSFDGESHRIVGVMGQDFLAPRPLSKQRQDHGAPAVYVPVSEDLLAAKADQAEDLLILGRSSSTNSILTTASAQRVSALAAARGGVELTATVAPLADHMRGNDLRTAGLLFTVAVILAIASLGGLAMMATGRFGSRRGDRFILVAIGSSPSGQDAFEWAEIFLLLLLSLLLAGCMLTLAVAVLAYDTSMQGVVSSGFTSTAVLLLIGYLVVSGLVMWSALPRHLDSSQSGASKISASRTRGADSNGRARTGFRVLIALQTLVALAAVSAVFVLGAQSWKSFRIAAAANYDGLSVWELEFPASVRAETITEVLARVKRSAASLPGVSGTAVVLASPLDLIGSLRGYSGPRVTSSEVVSAKDGVVITRSKREEGHGNLPAEVRYQISVVSADPEFFSIMGYQLVSGRIFAAQQENAALLTPAAASAIFGGSQEVIGEPIPAGPQATADEEWHDHLQVGGIVRAGKVSQANPFGAFASGVPVVFVPYKNVPRSSDGQTFVASILIKHTAAAQLDSTFLRKLLSNQTEASVYGRSIALKSEVHRRLVQHLVASSATLVIGIAVLLAACLGAMGGMQLTCQQRLGEIVVRMALGARETQIFALLVRQELLVPVTITILWWVACTAIGLVAQAIHVPAPISPLAAAAAVMLVLATLSMGFMVGMWPSLKRAPMDALRDE